MLDQDQSDDVTRQAAHLVANMDPVVVAELAAAMLAVSLTSRLTLSDDYRRSFLSILGRAAPSMTSALRRGLRLADPHARKARP